MTTPSGSQGGDAFQYGDDSVVANIEVNVPPTALTDLSQIREASASLRVELEAIARATSDWSEYQASLPEIAERVNQAYQSQITMLERMAYIQQEMGGMSNVGPTGSAAGQYSTAAPAGYVDPFTGMMTGTGMYGAYPMNMGQGMAYMQNMQQMDPRLFANMQAQRGNFINPGVMASLGYGAAASTSGMGGSSNLGMGRDIAQAPAEITGTGAAPAASTSPQPTQSSRTSADAPDASQGGAPASSEPQHIPSEPGPNAPPWQQALAGIQRGAGQVANEIRSSRGGNMGGMGMLAANAAGGISRWASNPDNMDKLGGFVSKYGGMAKGLGVAGGIAAAAVGVNNKVQDIGEDIQGLRSFGQVRGGDAMEGAGYEIQARIAAINPFLTTEQSRSIMQSALSEGYTGKTFDNVVDFMTKNLTEMNMSIADSMKILNTTVEKGKSSIKGMAGAYGDLGVLKNASKTGEMALPALEQSYTNIRSGIYESGSATPEAAGKAATELSVAFKDNRTLGPWTEQGITSATQSDQFLIMMATANNMPITYPEDVWDSLDAAGVDYSTAIWNTFKYIAQMAGSKEAFQRILNQLGVQISRQQARELWRQLSSGADPAAAGRQNVDAAKHQGFDFSAGEGGFLHAGARAFTGSGQEAWSTITSLFKGDLQGAEKNYEGVVGNPMLSLIPGLGPTAGMGAGLAHKAWDWLTGGDDQKPAEPGDEEAPIVGRPGGKPAQGQNARIETQGQVQGTLRVVVDQDGRVSAPNTIQLTGNQTSANFGYGTATQNNPGPDDLHTNTGWRN